MKLPVEEVLQQAFEYIEDETTQITHIGLSTLDDMVMLTLPLKTAEEIEETGYDLDSEDGQFCYCYNLTYPDCSELGYCFFEKGVSGFKRTG